MPRYLVTDLESTGHHARYVKWVVEGLASIPGAELIVAGPKSLLEHSELAGLAGRFVPLEVSGKKPAAVLTEDYSLRGLLKKQVAFYPLYTKAVRDACRGGGLDGIVLPLIDQVLYSWAALGTGFGKIPWLGISMVPTFHLAKIDGMTAPPSRRGDRIRERLFRRLLRDPKLKAVLSIDPVMLEYANLRFDADERKHLIYLPDPSVKHSLPPRESSREQLGIPNSALVVLLYGALHPRKGVQQLMSAANSPRCPATVHLMFAGHQSEEVKELLRNEEATRLAIEGRLHIIDRYVDDNMEKLLLSAANFMWVGYSGFYRMSGILVLATQHQLPSIFTKEGIIGYLGRKYELGPEIDPASPDSAVEALSLLAACPQRYRASIAAAAEVFEQHSIERFQSLIVQTVTGQGDMQRTPMSA